MVQILSDRQACEAYIDDQTDSLDSISQPCSKDINRSSRHTIPKQYAYFVQEVDRLSAT